GVPRAQGRQGLRPRTLRRCQLRDYPPAPERLRVRPGPAAGRAHRQPVGRAHAASPAAPAVFVAVAAATALRGPGRALRGAVLLGLLLHDAGPRRERAPRPAARDGRQLRLADRLLRPRAERQSQLLPEPLAAAGVRADGGAVRGPRRERGGPLPAAAAPRACVLG